MRRWIVGALALAACDARTVVAVSSIDGGVYRPDASCTLVEEGRSLCPTGAPYGFDNPVLDPGFSVGSSGTLTNLRVNCEKSFCGGGSLTARAVYSNDSRMGVVVFKFPQPRDLFDKILSFRVFVRQRTPVVDRDGFRTPINGQLAIIHQGRWRQVDDGPLLDGRGWNVKIGKISAENTHLELPASTRSVLVSEIQLQVYLATDVRPSGDTFIGDIFIDEFGWQ